MAMPKAPIFYISANSQKGLLEYFKQQAYASFQVANLRSRFEYIDKEYMRENQMQVESLKSRGMNEAGNKRKIQDVVIPIVEPQVETAHSYLTSVFLTGVPIFGVVSDKDNADQAVQMESIIENQSLRAEAPWTRQFSKFFRHGLKYNFSAIEVDWCVEKTWGISTDTSLGNTGGSKLSEVSWAGNCVKCLDPYNIIYDPRVDITEQHVRAEFAGYTELYNRVALMQKLQALPTRMNMTKAYEEASFQAPGISMLYYIPTIFTENFNYAKMAGLMNWDTWASTGLGNKQDIKIRFKNLYVLATRYCRIVPEDFGLRVPNAGQVQIWKFLTVNDQVIVYGERQTNAHNMLPILFGQPTEDGLNLQTKSLAQKMIPFQDLASAHANAHLAARRKAIGDRIFYDPSRIDKTLIDSENPAARIPVRPSAYGQPVDKAVHRFDFKWDETRGVMADVREVGGFADYVSGQNKAQQGQFTKGNRTKAEYEDITGRSSGRQQSQAILLEAQVLAPAKHIIKYNILQYQPPGKVYSIAQQKEVQIKPEELRTTALKFKVSDGIIPSDKIIDGDTLSAAMQMVGSSNALAEEYNVGDIFSHLIKSRGVDISQYKWTDAQKTARQQQQLKMVEAEGRAKGAGQAQTQNQPVPGQQILQPQK